MIQKPAKSNKYDKIKTMKTTEGDQLGKIKEAEEQSEITEAIKDSILDSEDEADPEQSP